MKPTLSDKRQLEQDVWTYEEEDVKEFIQTIIKRLCYPNKPINTFEYARQIKQTIEEEAGDKLK